MSKTNGAKPHSKTAKPPIIGKDAPKKQRDAVTTPPSNGMQPPQRAIILTRVSTDANREGTSPTTQLAACQKLAQSLGASVVKELHENVSGALNLSRTETQEALSDLDQDKADVLLMYDVSRYSRDLEYNQQMIKRIIKAGKRLYLACMELRYEPSGELTPDSEIALGMFGTLSQSERLSIKKRTTAGRMRVLESGRMPGAHWDPFGYHLVNQKDIIRGDQPEDKWGRYVLVPEQAKVVKKIYEAYLSGQSLNSIKLELNASSVPTMRGGAAWYRSTIRNLLRNPIYKGTPVYGKTKTKTDEGRLSRGLKSAQVKRESTSGQRILSCEPIVSVEVWAEVNRRLASSRSQFGGPPLRRHLLSGLVFCPTCGLRLSYSFPHGRVSSYYLCKESQGWQPRHKTAFWKVADLEPAVIKGIEKVADSREVREAIRLFKGAQRQAKAPDDVGGLKKELSRLTAKESALVELQIDARLNGRDESPYTSKLEALSIQTALLRGKIKAAEEASSRIATVASSAPAILDIASSLLEQLNRPGLSLTQKNRLLATIIEKVIPSRTGCILHIPCPGGGRFEVTVEGEKVRVFIV